MAETWTKHPGVVERTLRTSTLLVPVMQSFDELNCLFSLNDTARRIWQEACAGNPPEKITQTLVQEYDTTEPEARSDVEATLRDLQEIGLLVPADTPDAP